jgi:phospholipid/cholesterol/gamma-HCH transport system substrate-binding protein
METRANYVLIGAFALVGFLGIFAFFLWFANIQLDRQYAYYDIDFPTVSGLSEASDVRFAGLAVGQVVDVRLSPETDGRVRVRVEVEAATPVRTDSVATIEAQGVTGVSFVGISAGTPGTPLLTTESSADVPRIEAGRSVLQSLSQDAPEVLAETLEVVRELRQLIGGANQQRVQNILENVEQASTSFAVALEDFSEVSGTVADFARGIDRFNETLDALTRDASGFIEAAEATLTSIDALSADTRRLLAQGSDTLSQAETTIATADRYIMEELGPATAKLRNAVAEVQSRFDSLSDNAADLMSSYSAAGQTAQQGLADARETFARINDLVARIDAAMISLDAAAQRFDGMIGESAGPLIAELRVATAEATSIIRMIGDTATMDLPVIMDQIRGATNSATRIIETVGQDLSSASGRLDDLAINAGETLDSARATFANANQTLSAINAALETGDRALTAAEAAFQGADRLLNEEVAEVSERLRATLVELEGVVGNVAGEIPSVTADLRAASRSAEAAFAQIASEVNQSAPAVRDFARTALPQYSRLAVETRALIENLDKLVEQVRRDPSRFFLDRRAPEFRR